MKNSFFNKLMIIGFLFILLNNLLIAEEKKDEKIKIKGKVVIGGEAVNQQEKSSKFYEYRDLPKGFLGQYININIEKENKYLVFTGSKIRQLDSHYTFSLGDYGKYKLDFIFDRIPHRFSFEGRSLYVETAPGQYILSDRIQIDAENAGGATSAYPIISDFLKAAYPIELQLERNKATINFHYNISEPMNFNMSISHEKREGTRPIGASFGFNFANEIAEPIDYRTVNFDANTEYSKGWGTVRAGYYLSSFDNNIQTLTWDNYYRINDRTYPGAYVAGDATSHGRMSLPPSNLAHKIYLNTSIKIFKSARLNTSFSYSLFNQDENLLPYTINTALVSVYADALKPPANTANAKANIASFDISFNTKLTNNASLDTGINYYNFDNKTTILKLPGYSRFDAVWEEEPLSMEPYSFNPFKYYANIRFNLPKNSSLKAGYSYYSISRTLGDEDEGSSKENTFSISFDSIPNDYINLRLSYNHGSREFNGEEFPYIPGFRFLRYFQADRTRDAVNLLFGISPTNKFDISFSYMLGKDDYTKSDYGLKSSDFAMYGIDIGYNISEKSYIYGFFYNEQYKSEQASRQSGAIFSTDPLNDWFAYPKDKVNTVGIGFNAPISKDKLSLNCYYSYSKAKGEANLFSPPGGTPDIAKQFEKGLDNTTLNSVKAKFTWKLNSNFSTAVAYWYEQYDLEDIVRTEMKIDSQGSGGGIYLGSLEPSYKYHVAFINFIYNW